MRIAVLGPLEVRDGDGVPVEVAGARLRTLLILLALAGGGITGTDRLVDGLWGEHPPAGAANALQALVSRLRRTLPDAVIEAHPTGYQMVVEPDVLDVARFERLVADGRAVLADDPVTASAMLREALALWRGPALVDAGAGVAAVVARLDELRLSAVEDRVEADLRLGRGAEVVTELAALVAEHPLRERLVGASMRALCAAGRPAEALTVFERTRTLLADELGTDPSPGLAALHLAVLRGEHAPARTNLRAGLTSFVGRDDDLARVGKLVGEYRLTTLTGPGGSGKTRLSVEVARGMLARMPDGVWLVELAPVSADVPSAVLAALGVRDHVLGGRVEGEPVDRLAAALGTRRILLVLDNCEHVVDAAATLADRLLGECPRLHILATSREPLGITGEALWPVEPLALPAEDATAAEAMSSPAVRLLVDRARAASPGFAIEDDVAAAIRLCRALDGMPLAIELAAARLRTMSAGQLATRLDDRFRLLTGGSRVALPRHQTLRAVVDWSWELLSDEERALWRRLAVFAGGATQEAAERVCAGGPVEPARVLDLLTALAEKSLLVVTGERYSMLETIKAYGLARLDEAGEREPLRQAHAAYFVELAESAEPRLRRHDQLVWLARLAAEHDNLTATVRAAVAAGDAPTAVRMVAAASWYWWLGGHKAEGAGLASVALALPGEVDDEHRAAACAMAALLALDGLRDEARAGEWFRTALQLSEHTRPQHPLLRLLVPIERVLGVYRDSEPALPVDVIDPLLADEDPWVRGTARSLRAHMLLNFGGHIAEAEADFTAALAEYRTVGERWGISLALTSRADLAAWRGEFATAIDHYEQALTAITAMMTNEDIVGLRVKLAELRRRTGDLAGSAADLAEADTEATRRGLPEALNAVATAKGDFARWDGDLDAARTHLTHAVAISRSVTVAPQFRATALDSLGYVLALTGDLAAARDHHAQALELAVDSVDAPVLAQVLVGIAHLAMCQGRPAQAAALLSAGVAVRGSADVSRVDAATVATMARKALGDDEFAAASRTGESATLTTARELAATVL